MHQSYTSKVAERKLTQTYTQTGRTIQTFTVRRFWFAHLIQAMKDVSRMAQRKRSDLPQSIPPYSRRVFLTRITNPAGNSITFTYDSHFCLTTMTDAVGQPTTLRYDDPNDIRRITSVEDPFSSPGDVREGERGQI